MDIAWSRGKLVSATVRAKNGGVCKIRYGDKTNEISTMPGQILRFGGEAH